MPGVSILHRFNVLNYDPSFFSLKQLMFQNMSAKDNDLVVIFKSVSESETEQKDIYHETFSSNDFQTVLIPSLDFEFTNLDQLEGKIKKFDDYAGVIFTSPRCVTAFELAVNENKNTSLLENWRNLKNFVVGEKTAKSAENMGLIVEGKESGNGEKLAETIIKDKYDKPFLYPMGSLSPKTFKSKLMENNIKVDDITVYKTKPHPELETNLKNLKSQTSNCQSAFFIYFSPSGIKFSLPILKKLQFNFDRISFIAIGPTTEASMTENELKVATTAAKPTPADVLNAVLSLKT